MLSTACTDPQGTRRMPIESTARVGLRQWPRLGATLGTASCFAGRASPGKSGAVGHCGSEGGAFVGASIDFKAAHKQVQVRPEEHGLLLFAFQEKLYHYRERVCHFGGRFSAFWWQRAGAFLLRQVHGLLAWKPHKAFLFVDDLLCALVRDSASEMFALVVLFFCAIAAPISWKKAQFQDSLI